MSWKDTNPKDAVGTKRTPVSVIPMPVIAEIGNGMLEGARKYGRHNYRAAGVRYSVYMDAAFRHLMQWWEGQDIDPDSGIHHLSKAMAALVVVRDSIMQGNAIDDRPPPSPETMFAALNAQTADIVDRHPEPAEPYTAADAQPELPFDQGTILQTTHDLPPEAFPAQGTTGREVFHSVTDELTGPGRGV